MTSSLAKCKQVFGRALLDAFLQQFAYLCDLPQYANGLIILKTDDRQFTLMSKKTLRLIFKEVLIVTMHLQSIGTEVRVRERTTFA